MTLREQDQWCANKMVDDKGERGVSGLGEENLDL